MEINSVVKFFRIGLPVLDQSSWPCDWFVWILLKFYTLLEQVGCYTAPTPEPSVSQGACSRDCAEQGFLYQDLRVVGLVGLMVGIAVGSLATRAVWHFGSAVCGADASVVTLAFKVRDAGQLKSIVVEGLQAG